MAMNEKGKIISLTEKQINICICECLKKYFNGNKINESLNNFDSPLYHNTSMEKLLMMMASNSIKSNYHRGYSNNGIHNGICFTRNKSYNPYTYYDVLITFDVNKLLNSTRGLKLLPYQDKEWEDLDEYEERLISRNGKPFTLNNLFDIVTEVLIILDNTCNEIIENGLDIDYSVLDLKNVVKNNIFGDKLKIIDNLKTMTIMSLDDGCQYIKTECEYN